MACASEAAASLAALMASFLDAVAWSDSCLSVCCRDWTSAVREAWACSALDLWWWCCDILFSW